MCPSQAAADPRVCASTPADGVARAGRERRINFLPWHRPVGVTSTSSETQGGKTGLSARVSGHHVVRGRTFPGMRPGNRQGW